MMNLDNLPSHALPIIFEKFDFETFANTFNVWRKGKDLKTQQHVLANTDLIPFFVSAGWTSQFLPFIHYAAHVQVLDALFYTPCYMLFHERKQTENAALMLKILAEEGHVLSKFTYSIFSIFYIPAMKEEGMQNLIEIVKNPGMCTNIANWVRFLHSVNRSWNSFQFDYQKVGQFCDQLYSKTSESHFNLSGWPISIQDLGKITCLKCKVVVVLFNFCN